MPNSLLASLELAVSFLEKNKILYAVIGGIALPYWGAGRFTHDIDIKIIAPNLDYTKTRNLIRAAFPEHAQIKAPHNPLIISVTIQGVITDFLLALPGYEEQIIERAVRHDLGGWSVRICSAEDLIIQKVVAGREKDWLDVEMLLIEQHARLDYAYITDWLAQFADALDYVKLLQRYNELVEKLRKLKTEMD